LRAACAAVLVLSTITVLAQQRATPIVGFLEDIPSASQPVAPGKEPTLEPHVRVAFAKTERGWQRACMYSQGEQEGPECVDLGLIRKVSWEVAHRGKRLGAVETDGWYDARYFRTLGVLKRVSAAPPRVGAADRRFASWLARAAHRPLVALRGAKPDWPRSWSEVNAAAADMEGVLGLFRRAFPKLPDCKSAEGAGTGAIERNHLAVIGSLRGADGTRLIGVRLDPKLTEGCDGPLGLEWSDLWFLGPPGKPPAPLSVEIENDLAPFRMALLDLGDYDGDGKAEALFWFSSHNVEGYFLYYEAFKDHVRFAWKYQ
jgi:hypothetical protein